MLPTGRGITSRSVSPVRIAYLGRSDLLKREVERRREWKEGYSSSTVRRELMTPLRDSGSYAEISCIAQKENEPKAVSRDTVVLYTGE